MTTTKTEQPVKLYIERTAYQKIRAFTDLCPAEISGLGKVQFINGSPVVTDVAIFDQVVSPSHSTIDPKALAKFQDERVRAGESMKEWTLWWHSHANMQVFFSSTDTDTIETSTEFPYLISLVVNKARQHQARLDVFSPIHMTLDLELHIIETADEAVSTWCQSEIDVKVRRPEPVKYVPVKYEKGKHMAHGGYNDNERPSTPRDIPARQMGFTERELEDTVMMVEEYHGNKRYLIKQIRKAESKKKEARAMKLREELAELLLWGTSHGIEVMREID